MRLQTLRYGLDHYGLFASAHRQLGDVFTVRVMGETCGEATVVFRCRNRSQQAPKLPKAASGHDAAEAAQS